MWAAALAGLLIAACSTASALNEGFESGDVAGFSRAAPTASSGPGRMGAVNPVAVVSSHRGETRIYDPVRGKYFLVLTASRASRQAAVRQTYWLKAGEYLTGYAAFDAHRAPPQAGQAAVRILTAGNALLATPFAADTAAVGKGGGPWRPWFYTAPVDGSYVLEYRVTHDSDTAGAVQALFDAAELDIDIQPGDPQNVIRPGGWGGFTVAIRASPIFDVATVVPGSLRFGISGSEATGLTFMREVDGGSGSTLGLWVRSRKTGIGCGTRRAFVTARLANGRFISGSDTVTPTCF